MILEFLFQCSMVKNPNNFHGIKIYSSLTETKDEVMQQGRSQSSQVSFFQPCKQSIIQRINIHNIILTIFYQTYEQLVEIPAIFKVYMCKLLLKKLYQWKQSQLHDKSKSIITKSSTITIFHQSTYTWILIDLTIAKKCNGPYVSHFSNITFLNEIKTFQTSQLFKIIPLMVDG